MVQLLLSFGNRVYGASCRARTAVYARIRVDFIFILAFGNRSDRTCFGACAALDTFIGYFVCHTLSPNMKNNLLVCYIIPPSNPFVNSFYKNRSKVFSPSILPVFLNLFCIVVVVSHYFRSLYFLDLIYLVFHLSVVFLKFRLHRLLDKIHGLNFRFPFRRDYFTVQFRHTFRRFSIMIVFVLQATHKPTA